MHDIFISYSAKDQIQADTVRDILEKNKIRCWMAPRDIPGGSNYTKEIPVAIRNCQVFVLILSQNSQNSMWVLKELDAAVNCGKVILPFMLEDCQLNDEFNFLLTGAQRYAAYQKKADALEALISRIRAIIGEGSDEPSPEPDPAESAKPTESAEPEPEPKEKPATPTLFLGISQCPSCGGSDLVELTKKIGRFTFVEKLTLLVPPITAFLCFILSVMVTNIVLCFIPYISWQAIEWIETICYLLGIVAGWILGNRGAKEWVRRQRVRKHIRQHPFRCTACCKVFLLENE